jgi:ribosome-associated translation inhibitor RaiA
MDIKVVKGSVGTANYFEAYSHEALQKLFIQNEFVKSINVYFRAKKHARKKIKLQARLKGKEIFVESSADKYPMAIDAAIVKLKTQISKYKTEHYNKRPVGLELLE